MLIYYQLDQKEQISTKFQSKYNNFHLRKCILNIICKKLPIFFTPQSVKLKPDKLCRIYIGKHNNIIFQKVGAEMKYGRTALAIYSKISNISAPNYKT